MEESNRELSISKMILKTKRWYEMDKIIKYEKSTNMQKIKELRSLGFGYRQISKKTDLKVDTIKKYCKRHKIAGYKGGMSDGWK